MKVISFCVLGSLLLRGDNPLPDPQQLRMRARASMEKLERDRENYSCTVQRHEYDLNADGSVKKDKAETVEIFYVNSMAIEHLLARDGKDLTGEEAKKAQEHADKEVKKYSDANAAKKERDKDEKQEDVFLRAVRFTNGHREARDGRSLVVYDLTGDSSFQPHKVEERFAQAVVGRIWMDEASGVPLELRFETNKDVKVGGGLLANLHKGFQMHLVQQRQPDGVWLTKTVDVSGDAKAALFLHPRFRFREDLQKCHLFSVNTQQKVQSPPK